MLNLSHETAQNYVAYAIGYHDGRAEGVANLPEVWVGHTAETLYRLGYDRGVADFCAEELDND